MGNPLQSSTLSQLKDLRQTNRVKNSEFIPRAWKASVIKNSRTRRAKNPADTSTFFSQFNAFTPHPSITVTKEIKEDCQDICAIFSEEKFKDVYNKFAIKYYRTQFDLLKNKPAEQKQIFANMKVILNCSEVNDIQQLDCKIAVSHYQFTPYNFRRKRDRAEFNALQKIVELHDEVERSKKIPADFQQHLNYVLYYLCELDNPEQINIDGLVNNNLKHIVSDFNQYKHYDKVRKIYLLALFEQLRRIVGSDDPKFDTQKKALAKQIADLLGIARKDILDIIDRSDKKELNTYVAQEFARFDISIPSPQDKKHFDSNVNGLIASLLTTWRELETSCPTASAAARDIAFQLAYDRHVTPQLHADLEALKAQLNIDEASEVGAKKAVRSTITQRLKDITNYGNSIYQNHQDNFRDAHLALKDYLENGRMPTVGNPSFIALIELLDKYVDPKSRYEKQSDGTYAAAAGLKPFLEAFENAKSDSLSNYENQQQVLTNFFDYVWQQLDIQQRYDLQDFDPNMPSQALINATFVRDGKKCLNEYARQFGIQNRGIKRNHPVEKLYLQINKLVTLLTADDQRKVRDIRNRIIGTHTIHTISHLPMARITNLEHPKNPTDLKNPDDIKTLTELKRVIQAKIRYMPRKDRIQNNLDYLLGLLRHAETNRPYLRKIADDAQLELQKIRTDLLCKNDKDNLATDADFKQTQENGYGVNVYYSDMQKLRAHLLAHLIAHNIPVPTMNPLGDLEPIVSEYHRVDKRRTVSATKQNYQEAKQHIEGWSLFLALFFSFGQVITGLFGMLVFQNAMPLWLAWTFIVTGLFAAGKSNYDYVYDNNLSLLRRFFVLKDFWLNYKSPSGKILILTTFAVTILYAALSAVMVGSMFPAIAATTPLLVAAQVGYQAFITFIMFVTFSTLALFMAVEVVYIWEKIYNGLVWLFPELSDANNKAEALEKSLGLAGLVIGICRGIQRFIQRDLTLTNFTLLLARFKRYFKNPLQDPCASQSDIIYKHLENTLLVLFILALLPLSSYICYYSCTSMLVAFGESFSAFLLGAGFTTASEALISFMCASLAFNFVNILFNADTFATESLNLAALCSKLTVSLAIKLPIHASFVGVYVLHQILSLELFYHDLFGKADSTSNVTGKSQQSFNNVYHNLTDTLSSISTICYQVGIILMNAVSFAAPMAMNGMNDPNKIRSDVFIDASANVANCIATNAAGAQVRYAMMMPLVIPQTLSVIGKFVQEKVTSKIRLDTPKRGDAVAPGSYAKPANTSVPNSHFFKTPKGLVKDISMDSRDSLRPLDIDIKPVIYTAAAAVA